MAATLGSYTFDERHTMCREWHEEIGGRDARRIGISGLLLGHATVAEIEEALDAVLGAASNERTDVALSLRTGRRMWVKRVSFSRQVSEAALVGAFELELEARDPFEEADEESSGAWTISASGGTLSITPGGTAETLPSVALTATGTLVNPALSDGERSLTYWGDVTAGKTLVVDGVNKRATLDGEDVTTYTTGEFPRLQPDGTLLTYSDDALSTHQAGAVVSYRARWW